ncbi:hypothetical protein SEVIR_8G175250v4 [Setaria viridis]
MKAPTTASTSATTGPSAIILSILVYARHQVRDSIDWELVRRKASKIVQELAYQTPELKDFIYIPLSLMKPHNVLPIGFGIRRSSHSKKQIRRPRAYALVRSSILGTRGGTLQTAMILRWNAHR